MKQFYSTATCKRCELSDETILHVLRDCPNTRRFWTTYFKLQTKNNFFEDNIETWIDNNIKNSTDNDWIQNFCTGIWVAWTCRNKELFTTSQFSVEDMRHLYFKLKVDIQTSFPPQHVSKGRILSYQRCPPSMNNFKLNIDDSSKGNP